MKAISVKNQPTSRFLPGYDLKHLRHFARQEQTPFMLLRTSVIRKNLDHLKEALPGVDVFYAVKANDHPAILKALLEAGSAFDISSACELESIIALRGRPENTIHSNPIKSRNEFDRAVELGGRLFVADNPDELDKFARYGDRPGLLIRFKTSDGGSVVNLSYKFGANPEGIPALLAKAKKLGIPFKGFCFHVGSQCTDIDKYVDAIRTAAELIEVANSLEMKTEILDIGGGFPIRYTEDVPDIRQIGRKIMPALREHIDPAIRIVCEPGRYLCGEAATLFSSVIGRAIREGMKWYYLDDGLYGSFSGRLFDQCFYQVITNRNTKWEESVLAGPTCDSFDIIYQKCHMPPLDIGDILMFPSMGAYTRVSATEFNGLSKARVIAVDW